MDPVEAAAAPLPSEGAPGLSVSGLTKLYGRIAAVDGLTFHLDPGEIVGLLGPNGAGKTTTLLCLAGLLRPQGGAIAWNGTELGSRRSRLIALIPETPEVYDMLTVWEHMVFVARSCRLAGDWSERAASLVRRLGLEERRDALGEELSKGMKQKLMIAASVLAATPVLLLDEPMIGLDPLAQRELRSILVELRNAGVAIMVSTHLLDNVQSFCDRLIILKQGRLQAEGPVPELLARTGGKSLEEAFLDIVG